MSPVSKRWHVGDPSALVSRHWAGYDEYLVFNAASGDLHLLNSAAAALLEQLSTGPATAEELAPLLNATDRGQIDEALHALNRLGLVDPHLS